MKRNEAAVVLGRRGARKRFEGKTTAQVSRLQRKAARARWDAVKATKAEAALLRGLTDEQLVEYARTPMPFDPYVNRAALVLAEMRRRVRAGRRAKDAN